MTINVFPSLMPGAPIETHEWAGTIDGWMQSKGIDYHAFDEQPVVVTVNGAEIDVRQWADTNVTLADDVEIRILPHGGVFKGLGSILGGIVGFLFGWLMPSQRSHRNYDTPQGRKLEVASADANQPRLGEVVPELAGRFRRFPDYLTPPRRYFVNRREQWLEFLCCVGPGRYQILPDDVRLSDSSFASIGANAEYQIFEPGANVSVVTAHEHWHAADEVGGTSSGTAGLELSVDLARQEHTDVPPEYVFSGNTISIPEGTGSFPPGWGPGTVIRITLTLTKTYAVTGGDSFPVTPNVFTGDFSHLMPIANGTLLTFTSGPLVGTYMAQAVSLDASGAGSMQLWVPGTPGDEDNPPVDPEPVIHLEPGNYSMTSVGVHEKTLTGASDEFVTYSGESLPTYTGPASIEFSGGLVYGEWSSTIAACPTAEVTNTLELDFFFPGGLCYIQDDGRLSSRTVRAEIQYRDANVGGAFTSIMKTYTEATMDQIGFTERISVSGIRPEVRVRRVGARAVSTQVQDTIHWYGLKSRLPTRTSYPDWTTISVKLRSGGKLAAQSENRFNVVATRILPTLQPDGTWGTPQPTRQITAFAKYIASTIGYTDDDLHMEEFERLNAVWNSRDDYLDHVFDQTTVREALGVAFNAGMAEMTIDYGRIKPVRDEPRSQYEHSYSPQNMTKPLQRSFQAPRHDDHDGVEVEYIDSATWSSETVLCMLPGDQGFKIEKMKLDGVTDRTQAWRIGMRRRRELKYRRWNYSFATELDALNSGYLSYVPLFDDIPGYGKSAILEHIEAHDDGALLHASEPMEWEEGADHVVGYRRPDGTIAGPFPAARGADGYQIIADIPKPWPVVTLKHEPPHVYFGTAERWTFPALITEINPQSTDLVRVSAVNYDERVYADDNNSPSQDD